MTPLPKEIMNKKQELEKAMKWWKTLNINVSQTIRWLKGDEIGQLTDEQYIEFYNKRSTIPDQLYKWNNINDL